MQKLIKTDHLNLGFLLPDFYQPIQNWGIVPSVSSRDFTYASLRHQMDSSRFSARVQVWARALEIHWH